MQPGREGERLHSLGLQGLVPLTRLSLGIVHSLLLCLKWSSETGEGVLCIHYWSQVCLTTGFPASGINAQNLPIHGAQ